MSRKVFWLTAFGLALLTIMAATRDATWSARAKQKSVDSRTRPLLSIDTLTPATLAIMRRQEALRPAVAALEQAQSKFPDSGFASIAFEDDGVTLYWKGPLPHEMNEAIQVARQAGPVQIKNAAFSLAELEAAAEKIHQAARALGGSEIQAVSKRDDGSGLDIERMPPGTLAEMRTARAAAGRRTVASAEQVLAGLDLGMPVRVTTASEPIRLMSRQDDPPAYWGGAVFETWRGQERRAFCSTGFGVRRGDQTFVVTAAHCGTPPDVAYQGSPRIRRMGPINSNEQWQYDLMLINAPAGFRIYVGPKDTGSTRAVIGWETTRAGQLVCHSGASSGTVCGLKVDSTNVDVTLPSDRRDSDGDYNYKLLNLVRTVQVDLQTAIIRGDSGGPVFTFAGVDEALAKGIVSGASVASIVYFQDWATFRSRYGTGYELITQ